MSGKPQAGGGSSVMQVDFRSSWRQLCNRSQSSSRITRVVDVNFQKGIYFWGGDKEVLGDGGGNKGGKKRFKEVMRLVLMKKESDAFLISCS